MPKPGMLTVKTVSYDCCKVESPPQIENLQLNNYERRTEFHQSESTYVCIFLSMTRDTELTCKSSSGLQSIQSSISSWKVRGWGNLYLVLQVVIRLQPNKKSSLTHYVSSQLHEWLLVVKISKGQDKWIWRWKSHLQYINILWENFT